MIFSIQCTSQTFDQHFPTDESCLEYLRSERWGDEEFVCPRCGSLDGYELGNRAVIQCAKKRCRYQASVTAGTIFHKTKLSIRKWFLAILHFSESPMLTVRELADIVQVSIKTAWLMLHKINHAYEEWKYEEEVADADSLEYDPLKCTEEIEHHSNRMDDDEAEFRRLVNLSFEPIPLSSWKMPNTASLFYFYVHCCVNSDPINYNYRSSFAHFWKTPKVPIA